MWQSLDPLPWLDALPGHVAPGPAARYGTTQPNGVCHEELHLTDQEMADMIGTSRQSVITVLKF